MNNGEIAVRAALVIKNFHLKNDEILQAKIRKKVGSLEIENRRTN